MRAAGPREELVPALAWENSRIASVSGDGNNEPTAMPTATVAALSAPNSAVITGRPAAAKFGCPTANACNADSLGSCFRMLRWWPYQSTYVPIMTVASDTILLTIPTRPAV
jgi:hypothetical protein